MNSSLSRFIIFFFFKKINLFNKLIYLYLLNKNRFIYTGKVSQAHKYNEEYVSNDVEMDLLVQGPILGISELICCLKWIGVCKKNKVQCIISTWNSYYARLLQLFIGKSAIIVAKKKPENAGPQNINRQMAGVMNGLDYVSKKYVLKVRTDHYPISIYCFQIIEAYSRENCEIIVGPSSAERCDELRDQYVYSTKKILRKLYEKKHIDKQEQINELCKNKYKSTNKNFSVENYIFDEVRNRVSDKIAIIPMELLGIGWAKYPNEFAFDSSDNVIKKQIRQKVYQ